MNVRAATLEDAAALAAVQTAALLAGAGERDDADTGEVPKVVEEVARWRALLGGAGAGWTLVAEDAAGLAGLATTAPGEPGRGEITLVCVLPERWEDGVGGELVTAALAALRERGCTQATAHPDAGDARGRALLLAADFVPAADGRFTAVL